MEHKSNPCPHVFDDRAALLKASMRTDCWKLTRTCARCADVLYPTRKTLRIMGIVDRLVMILAMGFGCCADNLLPLDFPAFGGLLISLAVVLILGGALHGLTRPILLKLSWQPMEETIGAESREDLLRKYYGVSFFETLVWFLVMLLVLYFALF